MFKLIMYFFLMFIFLVAGAIASEPVKAAENKKFNAKPSTTEVMINEVKIKYVRDENGCSEMVQFWNDPERCGENSICRTYAKDGKARYIDGLPTTVVPKIEGEAVISAGNTIGPTPLCNEFIITTHGSPGWVWNNINGNWTLICIGYYYSPLKLCCDPTGCVPKP